MRKKKSFARNIIVLLFFVAAGFVGGWAASSRLAESARSEKEDSMFASSVAMATPAKVADKEAIALRRTPVVEAVEKVSPAVVNISTEKVIEKRFNPFGGFDDEFFNGFFDSFPNNFPTEKYKQQTLGSGVIINPKGYILTNEHVILRASKVVVTLPDEREIEARVIGADPKFDLAILKVDVDKPLPTAQTGDSEGVMIGETVIAIGSPFGLKHTVTTGVVSAIGRSVKTNEGQVFSDFIQTDASINPGNSGGPLVNIVGEVIGINTAIYAEAEGIGFAIPINRAMRAVAELIRYGKIEKTWTGIRVQELTGRLAATLGLKAGGGVLVSDVLSDSPGESAGIKAGDVIVKIDTMEIGSIEAFLDRISGSLVGDTVNVEIVRDGKTRNLKMKMAGLPIKHADKLAKEVFGVTVSDIGRSEQLRYKLYGDQGVVVTDVDENSPAAKIGMRAGDVIRQFGNREINSVDDFREAVAVASVRESVFLVVQRGMYLYHVRI